MIRFDVTIVDSGCRSKRIRLILQNTYCKLDSYPWCNISDFAMCALIVKQIRSCSANADRDKNRDHIINTYACSALQLTVYAHRALDTCRICMH